MVKNLEGEKLHTYLGYTIFFLYSKTKCRVTQTQISLDGVVFVNFFVSVCVLVLLLLLLLSWLLCAFRWIGEWGCGGCRLFVVLFLPPFVFIRSIVLCFFFPVLFLCYMNTHSHSKKQNLSILGAMQSKSCDLHKTHTDTVWNTHSRY